MRILFAGGGTGGHIYPGISIAQAVEKLTSGHEFLFVIGTRENEADIVKNAGFEFEQLSVSSLPRAFSAKALKFPFKLASSLARSFEILKKFRPGLVIATGGYVSAPPIMAAMFKGVPFMIQEQNSYPGITTRLFSRHASLIFLGFENAAGYLKTPKDRIIVTGNPVRIPDNVPGRTEALEGFGLSPELPAILVFGGSQGSRAINRAFAGAVEKLSGEGIQSIWQTGKREYEEYKRFNGAYGGKVRTLAYIENMTGAYAASDLAVGRAGAMTTAELSYHAVPSILIPLPSASEDHQTMNARSLAEAGSAILIHERELTSERLGDEIFSLMKTGKLKEMSKKAQKTSGGNAALIISKVLIERYPALKGDN